jgi:hypothetical protein
MLNWYASLPLWARQIPTVDWATTDIVIAINAIMENKHIQVITPFSYE